MNVEHIYRENVIIVTQRYSYHSFKEIEVEYDENGEEIKVN